MRADSSIAISIAQLLDIRHLQVPATRSAPVSNSIRVGMFNSRKRGHGTDYDDLRAYSSGDDIRHIDWRVSARMQELHTRLYREEKEHRTSIICDLRPCMFTGSTQLRANKAVLLAARFLWLASLGGTRVNLLLLTPTGVSMMEPGSGHATAIRGCALLSEEHQRIATTLADTARNKQSGAAQSTGDASIAATGKSRFIKIANQHVRQHTLSANHPAQGPLLDALLQWMIQQQEHKSTLLWPTALNYAGEHFFDSISTLAPPSNSVFVYVDEPVLQSGLPSGEYHYEFLSDNDSAPSTTHQSSYIDRVTRRHLQQQLTEQSQARFNTMISLQIPYISTASGDTEVIAALRNQAYLP